MKPRILILMHYMELGGAESALLGLLQALDPGRAEVDLFVYDHRGALMEQIVGLASNENDNENENNHANRIRLLPQVEAYSMLERPLSEAVRRGYWRVALMRLIGKLEAKITGGSEIVTQPKWVSKVLPFINEDEDLRYKDENEDENEDCHSDGSQTSNLKPRTSNLPYDLAISFVTPHYFVLNNVRAKKKVGWIHTDYTKIQVNAKRELKMWSRLDNIVSISPDVTRTFLQVFPSLKDKIVEIENILPKALIEEKSSATLEPYSLARQEFESALFCSTQLNLLSIGRICDQKNFDNIPYMAKTLKELFIENENEDQNENYRPDNLSSNDFHWYIIGPGNSKPIEDKLKELRVDDLVTFLGPKDNPYPYIKACDIYVQPSRYEGKSVTVREAQMLCKPVIITNYPTAKSQIRDGIDGVICGMDNKEIAEAIYNLANDKAKQQSIIAYLKEHDYSGMSEVEKVYKLLE